MNIALDLDDTICDTASVIMEKAIEFHKTVLHREVNLIDVNDCEDYFYFAHSLGWENDEVRNFFSWCYPYYLKEVTVLDGVSAVLRELHDLGCKIHIVTARYLSDKEDVVALTRAWLDANKVVYDTLDIGQHTKIDAVKKYRCEVFVDDSFKNCCEIEKCCPVKLVMLMSSKYNENLKNEKIIKIDNWNQLKNNVLKLKGEIYE